MAAKLQEIEMMSYFCKKSVFEKDPHNPLQFHRGYRSDHAGHPLREAAGPGR